MPHPLSQFLYIARWVGTLLVLAVHGATLFVNFGGLTPENESAFVSAWRFLVSYEFGRQGVIGFFVMSGFLVGGAVLARLRDDKPFLLDYCIHRFARIYLVLIPAIAITFLLDTIGRSVLPPDAGLYGMPHLQEHFSPRLIMSDLVNLQGIVAPYYGTNGPLWSIAYEFWYYLFFPLLLLPFGRAYPPRTRYWVAGAVFALCVAVTLRQAWFAFGFLIWAMGALLTVPRRPLMRSFRMALALDAGVILVLRIVFSGAIMKEQPWLQYVCDAITAAAFANLILTMRFSTNLGSRALDWPIHKQLADFSFTVYAVHAPILMFLRAAASLLLDKDWFARPAAPVQWAALAAAMTISVVLAYLLSRVTEAKVGPARRTLRDLVARMELLFGRRRRAALARATLERRRVGGAREPGRRARAGDSRRPVPVYVRDRR